MIKGIDIIQLSKTVSHALRHEPWLYELELDEEGWCDISQLLLSMHKEKIQWASLTIEDLKVILSKSDKKRHEIKDGKIRALYGHSIPKKLIKIEHEPPEILYHGTSPEAVNKILVYGLKPMQRQFVHLSIDKKTAFEVGKRKALKPIILEICAKKAYLTSCPFYIGNEKVWLADYIPSEFINILY